MERRLLLTAAAVLARCATTTGDMALLSGRTRMTGRDAGKPFGSHDRDTAIDVRRGGACKIVSMQISK